MLWFFSAPSRKTYIFSIQIVKYLLKSKEKELGNKIHAFFSTRLSKLTHRGIGLSIEAA